MRVLRCSKSLPQLLHWVAWLLQSLAQWNLIVFVVGLIELRLEVLVDGDREEEDYHQEREEDLAERLFEREAQIFK